MMNPMLTYYGLFLSNVSSQQFENQPATIHPELTITLKSNSGGGKIDFEQFCSDIAIMNTVRETTDPAVKEAFEQMLTVMALTSGRTADK